MLDDFLALLLRDVLLPFRDLGFVDRCLAASVTLGIPVGYVFLVFRYRALAAEAAVLPHLSPVSVKGGIAQELGAREVSLILRAHWSAFTEASRRGRLRSAAVGATEAVGREFRYAMALAIASLDFRAAEYPEECKIEEELVVRIGGIQVPVGAILNAVVTLLRVVPVPHRARYRSRLIHVSLASSGEQTQLTVARGESSPTRASVLTVAKPVKDLTALSDLLRDAVFMILHVHGKAFPTRDWHSMRHVADGLDALDEYGRSGTAELLGTARDCFRRAAEAGWDNYEALYFYASLLMVDLTVEGITRAVKMFGLALEAADPKFRAFVYAGLAYCQAQKFHRLARREADVLESAQRYARRAMEQWARAGSGPPHPLILATTALVGTVDEGSEETRDDARKRFEDAARLYGMAIAGDPENATFHNNLGWVMLKLAEWGVEQVATTEDLPQSPGGNPAELSERYLRRSLELNPTNKLSHANLCLLYATPWYRKRDPDRYLQQSRYYGIMATRLDPKYINGHRDLAVSLLRYGRFDEAYQYFLKALQLAGTIEKDQELIRDVAAVLAEVGASEKEKKRWHEPPEDLLLPPEVTPHVPVAPRRTG
jgi:tetratricopeptide (TPR) repeat protein